ncbi:MAG: hypothetical protein IJ882_03960 [Paludibacteraceae bacterium]|nr:hypothetical protein [Paludibacteraceae bacterium]
MQAASDRTHQGLYLPAFPQEGQALLLSPYPDGVRLSVTTSAVRGAAHQPVGVVRVVVVVATVVVDIPEVVGIG